MAVFYLLFWLSGSRAQGKTVHWVCMRIACTGRVYSMRAQQYYTQL